MAAFRLAAAVLVALALGAPAPARAAPIVHRMNVPAGEAAPTDGSFSIRFPIKFTDVELRVEDPKAPTLVTRMLTGKSDEGVLFSATEAFNDPPRAPTAVSLDRYLESFKKRPMAVISNLRREKKEDTEIVSFSFSEAQGGSFFHMVQNKTTLYMQVIPFPETLRAKAASMKDVFFGSFRITKP
jgi:hypothetical protein